MTTVRRLRYKHAYGRREGRASLAIAPEVRSAAPSARERARPHIAVFVVFGSRLYREALAFALQADNRLWLSGSAPDVAQATAALRSLPSAPDVLLLDNAVADGVAAVHPLLDAAPGMAVVALAAGEAEPDMVSWFESGAAGLVGRDASLQDLLANIRAVARGETLCSPRLAAILINRVAELARERRSESAGMAERLHVAAAGVERRRSPDLSIRLLGNLGVHRDSVRLPTFPTQRSEALFAYLVLHRDRLVHREVLCGEFWGDCSDAEARKSLRTTLWRIRSVLEPDASDRGTLLRVEGDRIGFAPPPGTWVDVWELEDSVRLSERHADALDEPTAQRLGRVTQLYRGEFMEGHYDDWCAEPRERLRTGFLTALERLVQHHEATGDWLGAIACAREILRHDPFREHVHRMLMACHHAMGDRPSAVRQYERCADVLRNLLAIEPMEETRQLCERIRGEA